MVAERLMRVRLTADDAEPLRALLREKRHGVAAPKRTAEGRVSVDAYVPEPEIDDLRREGISVEVLEDATATGLARQAEVGTGNRFAAEEALPTGLGEKLKDER
jgi:hypothetical protein